MKVYPQKESWSCGAHSTGRALIMKGRKRVEDMPGYVGLCPKSFHDSIFGATSVGPCAEKLAQYSGGVHVDNFTALEEVKKNAQHLPLVVLIGVGGVNLLFVTIVGYNRTSREFGILDTNNAIYVQSTTDLVHQMKTWAGVSVIMFG